MFSGLQSAQLLINRLQAERDPLVWQRDPPPSLPPTPVRGAGFEDPPSLPDFGNRIQEREQLKRRWAEEALRKSERLRLTMLSHVPAVIWIVDAQLHFTHVVGGDPVNIGLSEDLVGRHVGDLDPEQLPQMQAEYHRRALAGERVIYELPLGSETIYESWGYMCRPMGLNGPSNYGSCGSWAAMRLRDITLVRRLMWKT